MVWVCRHLYYCGAKTLRQDAPPDWKTFQAKLPSNAIQTQDLLIENLAHCTKTATGLSILRALHLLGTGIDSHILNHHSNNVMGTASVFQLSGPMFDSQRITLCIIVNSRQTVMLLNKKTTASSFFTRFHRVLRLGL